MKINNFSPHIWQAEEIVGPNIPLHIHLVKGPEYAVLIDSGLNSSFPMVQALLEAAQVAAGEILYQSNSKHYWLKK